MMTWPFTVDPMYESCIGVYEIKLLIAAMLLIAATLAPYMVLAYTLSKIMSPWHLEAT
jgi:hypothetical protein